MTTWQEARLSQLARAMVHLEAEAHAVALRQSAERASEVWLRREDVQFHRSCLMRKLWLARKQAQERKGESR